MEKACKAKDKINEETRKIRVALERPKDEGFYERVQIWPNFLKRKPLHGSLKSGWAGE